MRGSLLSVAITGDLETGDLINFSYKVMRQLDRIRAPFFALINIHEATLTILEGLEGKISKQFNDLAREKKTIAIAYVLPPEMCKFYLKRKCPESIRVFEDSIAAMHWLESLGLTTEKNASSLAQFA
ncbi:MAG: hypothetical protein A2268_10715 [Candidatus Raymondbacteria bacterium RifOxyA12_full_50_37]|uniref:STAS/SEC14 domain-containing protein n=1 Tax=Candidatus Raymondbacteria bacterium RIFOXYD12_FULL_49_13 TaxID=1817890 RepID=A0A1F7F8X1_UNCRA|nr:MAG: hypothetical protein A2268_10715 [Candidatus Raymondbacteria bacterium RifOxyA12_full_50_37]OGJ85436.1 MAG: hypothetical protein A2248_12500 [Candidatus Raymondbacteria bacterium RIFOXYA2_FULL_49_16]OGJ91044.1 MAG: hypothetical protein A2350_07410 [Candidatus Raymondbacteria bacterium RifOxyB12_full_50_8]OGJ94944.1 MAG: hypothetical protein A2453_07970 [Candidatus Raymondbacteria bacterium RIFOXYC2_FULL_50_21]OGK03061.1 MAG: hypothetical protein A2519_21455 [Candidatus Raymondbacteria b